MGDGLLMRTGEEMCASSTGLGYWNGGPTYDDSSNARPAAAVASCTTFFDWRVRRKVYGPPRSECVRFREMERKDDKDKKKGG